MNEENGSTAVGGEMIPVVICDLVGSLEVRRCIKYRGGEPPKTYGNVSPGDMSYEAVDEESINKTKKTQEDIWKLAREQPRYLPRIITELVNRGIYYESAAFFFSTDKVAYKMNRASGSWPDGLWSSQVIADTVIGIGEPALPLLEGREEQFVRILKAKLNLKIDMEKGREKLRQMGSRIGRFFVKH